MGIPKDGLQNLANTLEGDKDLNSPRELSAEAEKELAIVEKTIREAHVDRVNPELKCILVILPSRHSPTGILMQREDVILEWIFLPCKPNKKLKTYIEKISDLIHKAKKEKQPKCPSTNELLMKHTTLYTIGIYSGISFPAQIYKKEVIIESRDNFVIRDEDTVILTYPKSVPYGSWFEHTRAWLCMRESDNFLVVNYEDMIKDTRRTIEKICDFLGKKLEPDELDLVLKYNSFQAMKENKMSNFSLVSEDLIPNGVPGDWKNYFTVAQAETFDKVFQEKMAGFPPELFPWK
ncbi:hypothetical protein STEG23_006898 [Scotinomys teguina]